MKKFSLQNGKKRFAIIGLLIFLVLERCFCG